MSYRMALQRLLACGLVTLSAFANTSEGKRQNEQETKEVEIVSLVRKHFFDRARAEAWAEENAGYAKNVRDQDAFVKATREALGRLKASHTAYFTSDDVEYFGLKSIFRKPLGLDSGEIDSIGVDVAPGCFVRTVFAGGPAAKAGLKRGDKILRADGKEFHPVLSFQGRAGRPVTLTVQSREVQTPHEVIVTPRKIDPSTEWLEAQELGARLYEKRGKTIAYMPLFSAAGEQYQQALREAIIGKFAKADALVLDFRDGWGGASPTFLNLFDRTAPYFDQIDAERNHTRFDPSCANLWSF